MIKVTVGITAYNEEKNIENLLYSVLNQKQKSFIIEEIIVISDASSDKTGQIVSQIKDDRIKFIKGLKRKGPNVRLNQIVSLMSKKSDCLITVEADTLPKNNLYFNNLISAIPSNGKFSIITGEAELIYSRNFFSQVIRIGDNFKKEVYEKAMMFPNLYLTGMELLSKEFLKKFRWSKYYHNDSYCYRRAIQLKLPIIRNKKAKLLIKTVDNIGDYLLQSGKFQKARIAESKHSDIYKTKVNYVIFLKIVLKYLCKTPPLFICYIVILIFGRLYSYRLPKYTPFWNTYQSSKNLTNNLLYE